MIETYLELSLPYTNTAQFMAYGRGVYWTKLTQPTGQFDSFFSQWDTDGVSRAIVTVSSVRVNYSAYSRKFTLDDCMNDELSFYWDQGTQTLYVHFPVDVSPSAAAVIISTLGGFCLVGAEASIYYNDVEYQPRITSIPDVSLETDKFQVGKMSFEDVSVTLRNGDGALDVLLNKPIPGAQASVVLIDTDSGVRVPYYTGYAMFARATEEKITLKIRDKRRKENIKVPRGRFSVNDHPNMSGTVDGKIIPEGYGPVNRIKAFPLNGEASSGNIEYRYATDATVLTKVEVGQDDVWSDVTADVVNSDVDTGYFELPYATATGGGSSVLSCVVTATLRSQTNPGDIIKDMNDRYNSVAYDGSNYIQAEWVSESAGLAPVAMYMGKQQEFFKWVEALQKGTDYSFLYNIAGDGRRTLRRNDPNRESVGEISYYDQKDDDRPGELDFSEYSSTVTVWYDKDEAEDSYSRYFTDDEEDEVLRQYDTPQDSEFTTLLTTEVNAKRKADLIAEDQKEVRPVFTVTLHRLNISKLAYKLYDIVTLNTSRPDDGYTDDLRHIIPDASSSNDIIPDASSSDDLILDYLPPFVVTSQGREYWGNRRCQILGIYYSPENHEYKLKMRERPVSEVV